MITAAEVKLVETMVERLGENFDSVQILVSRIGTNGTSLLSRGNGNYYARVGMCMEFVENSKADTLSEKINRE